MHKLDITKLKKRLIVLKCKRDCDKIENNRRNPKERPLYLSAKLHHENFGFSPRR
jgi:hypothetical protein